MKLGCQLVLGTALLVIAFVSGAPAAEVPPPPDAPGSAGASAEIELRKTFRSAPRPGRQPARARNVRSAGDSGTHEEGSITPSAARRIAAAAAALGEPLQSSGTLHLPGIDGPGLVVREELTPVLEFGTGRRVIVDMHGAIPPGVSDEIGRLWPGYSVVHPPAGGDLRSLIGSLLDAAGYESVLRSAPVTLGRGATIRFTPDFVILRGERDLLDGETRALSVVEPAEALPAELRELAADQRVRFVELTPDGALSGTDRAPWSDPAGRVTTAGGDRLAPLLGEIAAELGLAAEPQGGIFSRPGEGPARSARVIGRGQTAVLVLDDTAPGAGGGAQVELNDRADLNAAIGALLAHFSIPAIGPAVEFHRPASRGGAPRFVIGVPGWLAQLGERRLLITGAALPQQVRLFLTREGLDIFEYRTR